MTTQTLRDSYGRTIDYLRVAVTDRCNLRCVYCMPKGGISFQEEFAQLTTSELYKTIETAAELGIKKVRFTGGEPLLRNDLCDLVHFTAHQPGIQSVHLTTNGLLLHKHLNALLAAGISSINISLDSVNAARYLSITRRHSFEQVWQNIQLALESGFTNIKLNVVALADLTADEIARFIQLTEAYPITVRFIELMPFNTNSGDWQRRSFTSAAHVLNMLHESHPDAAASKGSSTEQFHFSFQGYAGHVAIIPAYTRSMCLNCSRLRLTSNGQLLNCLYSKQPFDLKTLLRTGASNKEIEGLFYDAVNTKPQNGHIARNDSSNNSICMTQIGG